MLLLYDRVWHDALSDDSALQRRFDEIVFVTLLSPVTIGLALAAVLVQSSMVEIFRELPTMLYLAYAVVMVILAVIYLQVEPFFLYTLRRRPSEENKKEQAFAENTEELQISDTEEIDEEKENSVLGVLSKRELEVVDLIAGGYSNGYIAKMLYILSIP